jgi:formylglycine-generating enzyme required for sulfatase activity
MTRPLYLGTTEVTQGQWTAIMATAPWKGEAFVREGTNYPATYVSYDDAIEFCRKLSEKEEKTYRLLTGAEWEYACRAGTTTMYHCGDNNAVLGQFAWFRANSLDVGEQYAHEVGKKQANAFGLYDMHGNISEWCLDWNASLGTSAVVFEPAEPARSGNPMYLGGSYHSDSSQCRSARIGVMTQAGRKASDLGFRVAHVPSER